MIIMECPFCNIRNGKNRILEEGKFVYVFLSNPRLVRGHTLVIPKRHVLKVSDLDVKERKELFEKIIDYQEKITSRLAKGCDIRQNYRPFLEQSRLKVDHVHFHLVPRELNDELYQKMYVHQKDLFKDLTSAETAEIIKILK